MELGIEIGVLLGLISHSNRSGNRHSDWFVSGWFDILGPWKTRVFSDLNFRLKWKFLLQQCMLELNTSHTCHQTFNVSVERLYSKLSWRQSWILTPFRHALQYEVRAGSTRRLSESVYRSKWWRELIRSLETMKGLSKIENFPLLSFFSLLSPNLHSYLI